MMTLRRLRGLGILLVMTALAGCAGQPSKPAAHPPAVEPPTFHSPFKSESETPIFAVPEAPPSREPELLHRLAMDISEQMNELEVLRTFVQVELSTVFRGQIRNDFPDPLVVSELYSLRGAFKKEFAAMDPRRRSEILVFYGTLEQINTYLLWREESINTPVSNPTGRVQYYDQMILSEVAMAQSADFSWLKGR
jgi:hypothetical protein